MSKVKCPKCGSEEFDCYDTNSYYDDGTHVEDCYCEECDCQFTVKYEMVEIKED
jgi:hypothetical protein